jgi:hypothetical protein
MASRYLVTGSDYGTTVDWQHKFGTKAEAFAYAKNNLGWAAEARVIVFDFVTTTYTHFVRLANGRARKEVRS